MAFDVDGLLYFPLGHRFVAQDLDIFLVHLVTGFGFVFPDS